MDPHADFVRKLEENRNGHFRLFERNGRALLQILPPGSRGRPVELTDVLARLQLFGLTGFDSRWLEDLVAAADGEEHDLCPWQLPVPVHASVLVKISEDSMSATVEIEPPSFGGERVGEAELRAALAEAGVTTGIDEATLADLVAESGAESIPEEPRIPARNRGGRHSSGKRRLQAVIARGEEPRPGKKGQIRHYFDPRPRAAPEIIPDGRGVDRVDFRKLNVIQGCRADQLLAEALPPEEGRPGRNVRGETIEALPGEAVRLIPGENTRLSPDGNSLISEIAGQVRISESRDTGSIRIAVQEVLELQNVDYSTGHIDFQGTVVISGTVFDGFNVRAAGDIVIAKSVGNVFLRAEGDIILNGGIVSRGDASIQAGGDLFARFVQSAAVFARGGIYIEEAAMHARLGAGGDIIIENGRGELIGGSALSGRLLRAKKIGARNETETRITVGLSPEIIERLEELEEEYLEKKRILEKVELHLRQIGEARRQGREYEKDQQETFEKLTLLRQEYGGFLENLDEQREAIYARIVPNPQASVEASQGVYPGTEIHFGAGTRKYRVENRPIFTYCRFVLEENRVTLRHSNL